MYIVHACLYNKTNIIKYCKKYSVHNDVTIYVDLIKNKLIIGRDNRVIQIYQSLLIGNNLG